MLVTEVVRQPFVDLDLEFVHGLEEQPRGKRDDEPDQRREDEQHAIPAAADERYGSDGRGPESEDAALMESE